MVEKDDPSRLLKSAELCGNCGMLNYITKNKRGDKRYTRSNTLCSCCGKTLAKEIDQQFVDPDF